MNLDENAKKAVQDLGDAINSAIEQSPHIVEAINRLREIGYEPNMSLKLEIGLQDLNGDAIDETDDIELELTDEDLRTLRRMKIKL